jgi:hypothetical protein
MPYEVSRSGPQSRDIAPNYEHRWSVAQEIGSPSVLLCPLIVNWARSWPLLASLHALQAGEGPNMTRISPAIRSWSLVNTGKKQRGHCCTTWSSVVLKRFARSHRAPGHRSWHRLRYLFAERCVRAGNVAQRAEALPACLVRNPVSASVVLDDASSYLFSSSFALTRAERCLSSIANLHSLRVVSGLWSPLFALMNHLCS